MRSIPLSAALASALSAAALGLSSMTAAPALAAGTTPVNVDVSQRHTNESEEAVAVNPTNPKNVVIVSNVDFPDAGMLEGVSFDGGATWATTLIGDDDNLGAACCDPSLSFDAFGNLFLTYLFNVGNVVPVAISTD
ncbi:MAG TPA: sialidase family protein, partial [Candidatus Eisenbacteria bacterium]|nr:sialidase family protein [Candidatus Eisenbacteria bacterium]